MATIGCVIPRRFRCFYPSQWRRSTLCIRSTEKLVFSIERLTSKGWRQTEEHPDHDLAHLHARLKNFADGSTYRVIDPDQTMVCLFSGGATECWAMDHVKVG